MCIAWLAVICCICAILSQVQALMVALTLPLQLLLEGYLGVVVVILAVTSVTLLFILIKKQRTKVESSKYIERLTSMCNNNYQTTNTLQK